MFKLLHSLFSKEAAPALANEAFQRLNEIAPLRSDPQSVRRSFVCREPILNRQEKVAGYEFLLNQRLHKRFSGKNPALRRAYDDGLIINLSLSAMGSLLGHRLSFVGLSPLSFDNPQLASLTQENTLLMVDPFEESGQVVEDLAAHLAEMRGRGFKTGCYLRPEGVPEEIIRLCDFVQLSTPAFNGFEISDWVRRLRQVEVGAPPALVAADIESADDFHVCFRAGFDYFHGPFVSRREDWHPPSSSVDRARIMQILGQLRADVEAGELARSIRQDPLVTYKLLRYINSAANGLQKKISSIEQGLLLLGRERFYRWLSLLLFDVEKPGYMARILIEQALVRASLLERLGQRLRRTDISPDHLFLTGLFSLLGKMIAGPLAETLAGAAVPAVISDALLAESGPLASFLKLAIASEEGDLEASSIWAAACDLDVASVNQDMLAALVWASEVLEMNE